MRKSSAACAIVTVLSLCPLLAAGQVRGVCVYNCEPPPVYTPSQPAGPSPQEIKARKEAKDMREAAEDEDDKGVDAYKRGDYDAAARHFREALEYAPGDPELLDKLRLAEAKIREARNKQFGLAAEQLKSAERHSQTATGMGDAGKAEALRGFDDGGVRSGTIAVPVTGGASVRDPVVPPGRRSPEIAALESLRSEARQKIAALEKKLTQLDPSTQSVEIAKAKQEKSTIESKVQYLNFSISQKLEAPDAAPK